MKRGDTNTSFNCKKRLYSDNFGWSKYLTVNLLWKFNDSNTPSCELNTQSNRTSIFCSIFSHHGTWSTILFSYKYWKGCHSWRYVECLDNHNTGQEVGGGVRRDEQHNNRFSRGNRNGRWKWIRAILVYILEQGIPSMVMRGRFKSGITPSTRKVFLKQSSTFL